MANPGNLPAHRCAARHSARPVAHHPAATDAGDQSRSRPLGILIALGATYILIHFGLLFDKAPSLQRMTAYLPVQMADGLLDALVLAALTGGALALWAGLMLWLRGIEEEANQWISLRRTTKVFDVPRDQVDRFVLNHANKVGWLLLLGSIYLFFAMFRLLV